jgi:phosphoribosyl 1,2-cyclic phosphate phosphodiesterase
MKKNDYSITILGCGGSDGVPQIGCDCSVCKSNDQKNFRTRSSVLVEIDSFKILIDAGPDLRQQALREGIDSLDAVLLTHSHYDHIAGVGDLKLFMKGNLPIPLYADPTTINIVEGNFKYAFHSSSKLYPKVLSKNSFNGPFSMIGCNLPIEPFRQRHGKSYSYGFRIGDFAYSTDLDLLDDSGYQTIVGVKVWVVDCMRYYKSPTHFSLDDTIEAILRVRPTQAIITHMSHEIDYNLLSAILPNNIKLGFDTMKISFES